VYKGATASTAVFSYESYNCKNACSITFGQLNSLQCACVEPLVKRGFRHFKPCRRNIDTRLTLKHSAHSIPIINETGMNTYEHMTCGESYAAEKYCSVGCSQILTIKKSLILTIMTPMGVRRGGMGICAPWKLEL